MIQPLLKPCQQKRRRAEAVRVYRGGREVCQKSKAGLAEYKRRTIEMVDRQGNICGICKDPSVPMRPIEDHSFLSATFQHADGRGSGGGRRNDSIAPETGNCAAHLKCNLELGSRRQ
jgi:hypothetical protein